METTSKIGLRNPLVEKEAVRVVAPVPHYGETFRTYNRKFPFYMHGAVESTPWPAGGLVSNLAAVRGVLPNKPAPFSTYKGLRVPNVSVMNGYQVGVGAFTGQRVGLFTQGPVLKPQNEPVTGYT